MGTGLTSAVVLAEAGFDVEIIAAKLSPDTTSDAAAAVWYPYHVEPREQADRWAVASLDEFRRLEREPDDFFARIDAAYRELQGAEPERIRLIDAGQPIDRVLAQALDELRDLL